MSKLYVISVGGKVVDGFYHRLADARRAAAELETDSAIAIWRRMRNGEVEVLVESIPPKTSESPASGLSYGSLDPEIAADWLSTLDVSSGTRRDYDLAFRTWCTFADECAYDFDSLEERHVLEFKQYLLDEKHLSPSAVSLYLNGVRSFYRFAESRGLENIARNVRGVKAPRGFRKSELSSDQARDLISSFGNDPDDEKSARDKAIVSLMLHTGLRDVEVVRADVRDLGVTGGFDVLSVHGKGRADSDEIVKLSGALVRDIRRYLAFREGLSDSSPLFASCARRNYGQRLTVRSVSRIVKNALKGIGVDDPRFTAHSLRHTAVTLALLGGAELADAQAMARHADISTTMIYSHHVDRLANAAEDRVASLLDV